MRKTKLGLLVLILLSLVILIGKFYSTTSKVIKIDLGKSFNIIQDSDDKKLQGIIEKNYDPKNGDLAVYIETLDGKVKFTLNETAKYPSASLYKLVLIAATLQEVELGRLKLESTLSASKQHLADVFGEVDFGYEEAGDNISYSVDEALTRVGRISDNFAAIMLSEKVRQTHTAKGDPLAEIAQSLGMKNTTFGDNVQTSTEDTGTYYKALYRGEIVSKTVSDQIVDYLALSQISDRIPALLPKKIKVIHKTGELAGVRHDAGLVLVSTLDEDDPESSSSAKLGKFVKAEGDYIIVLMAKNIKLEDSSVETLAKISKDVFDYLSQR